MNRILLIDDEGWEKDIIGSLCQTVFGNNFRLDHASVNSEAVRFLLENKYSLILLDNNLSFQIDAKFSVPFLKECSGNAEIVIISNNIFEDYLEDPAFLGVDKIIEKKELLTFLVEVSQRDVQHLAI
jgi:DNA-binding response OmpR family regulator